MGRRITDAERLERYKSLGLSRKEELELLAYDKQVEESNKANLAYDLSAEENKIAQKLKNVGSRKTPPAYQWTKRTRKPNEFKGALVEALAKFLEESDFELFDIKITNKERQISFATAERTYDLTLVQHNKPKGA